LLIPWLVSFNLVGCQLPSRFGLDTTLLNRSKTDYGDFMMIRNDGAPTTKGSVIVIQWRIVFCEAFFFQTDHIFIPFIPSFETFGHYVGWI